MNSTERVSKVIRGERADRTPIYGWVGGNNIPQQLAAAKTSVAAFEDHYEFDAAHIFGGPGCFDGKAFEKIRASGEELTPDLILDIPFLDADNQAAYQGIIDAMKFHKERGRFCYVQTPGLFEHYNGAFGIENHLCYLAMYKDEIAELYRRQAQWNIKFAMNCIDLGIDMVHISDDWGAQNGLMFNPKLWWEIIYPNMKAVTDAVKARGCFVSLHSDGCVAPVVDGIAKLGFDVFHPWQESANMPYSLYLDHYADKFALLGGICIQTTLGFGNFQRLESEIRRIFGLLKGKRWICCTTHFVQDHCTVEELTFAYDLIYRLARE